MSSNSRLRVLQAGRHIVMGLILIASAVALATFRKFGQLELPPITAYILAGILIVYGLFRIWRGTQELRQRKEVDDFIS